jgi:hypothetical protein
VSVRIVGAMRMMPGVSGQWFIMKVLNLNLTESNPSVRTSAHN